MGDEKGFLKVKRRKPGYRPVCERVKDFREVAESHGDADTSEQASRCMDCGTPFCHWGCPVGNNIPEWNDYVFAGNWKKAYELLAETNNLPEITGRVCPAPCEYACVLGINDDPVTIRENELTIIEHAFRKGWVKPISPKKRTGKKVAIIGSGPSGISAAAELNKAGHKVTVFERDDRIGGILRYGIPDFKLGKDVLDRRIDILKKEGIVFRTNVNVGVNYTVSKLTKEYDAIVLAGGSRKPRDLNIEGREFKGIHFAMDYLVLSNKKLCGSLQDECIDTNGKKVVVIGGGDTGSDCVGTAHRQGAACVTQIELLERPPECRSEDQPWPNYPMLLKVSTSHEEGGERHWSVLTKSFTGEGGHVKKLRCVKVDFSEKDKNSCPIMREMPGSEFEIDADLVILAVGFVHPQHEGLLSDLKIEFDKRGNVRTDDGYMTSKKGIFSAGDMRRGQSLIVWAISEGRKAAQSVDRFLLVK